ncbi:MULTISPECIES: ArsR/SmtB family transcription factor [unclassified Lebetimonas]|jgi:ArsR family transcriptional regulator|uniref:ArsR/SmtB family transcription factor n=1 Tax=unclassified Lebetimonas TaxID=2648158 RepID=UPI000466A6B0|nr:MULTISPECIES: metalloregulator ArsR/SmtB family transcription factor [unclassified Lebetimonas]
MLTLEEKVKAFKALGHKTRLEIFLNILRKPYVCGINKKARKDDIISQALCVGVIAEQFEYSLPTISRHIKELKEANLIKMEKIGNRIFLEPNMEVIKELQECFNSMVKE